MDSELNIIIESIKSKTGIEITIFAETLKYSVSTKSDYEVVLPTDLNFKGVFSDAKNDKTYFRLKYKTAKLIGMLDSASGEYKNYATLIMGIIDNFSSKETQLSQPDYLKNILLGECNKSQIDKYIRKYGIAESSFFILVIYSSENRSDDITNLLVNFSTNPQDVAINMEEGYSAFLKFEDETGAEYQSPTEYADFLAKSILQELGIEVRIGVGSTVKSIFDANVSYQNAVATLRMCEVMNSKGQVHNYKEFLLIKMLEDVPKFKLNEYFKVLLDEEAQTIFSDPEMIGTAEEFLENSLNVSETSRKLFIHRNTLMYRLDKIEKITGLNIRNFPDAVNFRVITILYKLLK